MNGSGSSESLDKLKKALSTKGYKVTKTTSTNDTAKTTIINKSDIDAEFIDNIKKNIDSAKCDIRSISLMCSPETLRTRLERDVAKGLRTADVVERSIKRLPLYAELDTQKLNTDDMSIDGIADMIIEICMGTGKYEQ